MGKINNGLQLCNFTKIVAGFALFYSISVSPACAQQITTTGLTNTTLHTNGNLTDVTTETIKGNYAFNSFGRFNVEAGKTVNLVVPAKAQNLINVVHDEASIINGILNSLKDNKIGGNIVLVNPHGLTVGIQGVVNVGSLLAVTPTEKFVDSFFNSPGNPDPVAVINLLNGNALVNENAKFTNEGQINAIKNIEIASGIFINKGIINTDAVFEINDNGFSSVVNTNMFKEKQEMTIKSGQVIIKAMQDVINSADFDNENMKSQQIASINSRNVNVIAGNNINGDDYGVINASGNIVLNSKSGQIGENENHFNIREFNKATISATARNDIFINELNSKMNVKTIRSNLGDVNLTAYKDIIDAKKDFTANIIGNNVTLLSKKGSIGEKETFVHINSGPLAGTTVARDQHLNIDSNDSFNASALNGDVYVKEKNGDLNIGKVYSGKYVELKSRNNILDSNVESDTSIFANSMYLDSEFGNIGDVDNPVDIQTNYNSENGWLAAYSRDGFINVNNTEGDLLLNFIGTYDTAKISSEGSIVNSNLPYNEASIYAQNIILTSISGNIGGNNAKLSIDTEERGYLKAYASNGMVDIVEISGDLRVDEIIAPQMVDIFVANGSLYSANSERTNITSDTIFLWATNQVGTAFNPLVIDCAGYNEARSPGEDYILNINDN